MKTQSSRNARLWFVIPLLLFTGAITHGQNSINSGSPAFVTNDNANKNTIYIPNNNNFYQFKIYKKEKNAAHYDLAATINQSSSDNNSATPYSLTWNDETPDAQKISYMIEAYSRSGSKICDLKVIWQAAKH